MLLMLMDTVIVEDYQRLFRFSDAGVTQSPEMLRCSWIINNVFCNLVRREQEHKDTTLPPTHTDVHTHTYPSPWLVINFSPNLLSLLCEI